MNELKEQMKGLSLIQKIDHLWTYYKIWLLIPIGIGVVIYVAFSAYRVRQENVLAGVVVVGSGVYGTEELEADLKEYMNSTEKTDRVKLHMNIPADNMAQTSLVSLSTLVGAEVVDVIVCPKETYEHFGGQGGFEDMETVLGDDVEKYADMVNGDAVIISDSKFLKEKFGIPYKEVYISVFVNAEHMEGAKAFVQYVLENI